MIRWRRGCQVCKLIDLVSSMSRRFHFSRLIYAYVVSIQKSALHHVLRFEDLHPMPAQIEFTQGAGMKPTGQ